MSTTAAMSRSRTRRWATPGSGSRITRLSSREWPDFSGCQGRTRRCRHALLGFVESQAPDAREATGLRTLLQVECFEGVGCVEDLVEYLGPETGALLVDAQAWLSVLSDLLCVVCGDATAVPYRRGRLRRRSP